MRPVPRRARQGRWPPSPHAFSFSRRPHRCQSDGRRHGRRNLLPNQRGQKAHAFVQETADRRSAMGAGPFRPLLLRFLRTGNPREATRRCSKSKSVPKKLIFKRQPHFPNHLLRIYSDLVLLTLSRRLMCKLLLVLLFVFVFSPLAFSAPGAVRCGKLLDVRSGQMLTDQTVVFDASGTITAVGSSSSAKLPNAVAAIDLSNATCLPGLIDVHTHLTGEPTGNGYASLGISVPREAITGVKNARLTVRAGFTTVRNVGASGYTDIALRDGIDAGDIEGPRMRVSGPALGITGGHCDNNLLPSEFHNKSEGVADGP